MSVRIDLRARVMDESVAQRRRGNPALLGIRIARRDRARAIERIDGIGAWVTGVATGLVRSSRTVVRATCEEEQRDAQ